MRATVRGPGRPRRASCGTIRSWRCLEEAEVRSSMLSSLRLTNFKNFANESIRFGPFSVIVGENAAGKSNLRDAIRFLHGIGRNYSLAEIVGGKTGEGGQQEWEPIRGGTSELIRFGCKSFRLDLKMQSHEDTIEYGIEVGMDSSVPDNLSVIREHFIFNDDLVYDGNPYGGSIQYQDDPLQLCVRLAEVGKQRHRSALAFSRDKPIATQIHQSPDMSTFRAHKIPVNRIVTSLNQLRFFDMVPDRMRMPAPLESTTLGDHGENLPAALMNICENDMYRSFIADWVSEFTAMDVKDIDFLKGPDGLIHLMIKDSNDRRISAYSASDGTLRTLSILAILYDRFASHSYFFEEIGRGMHPSRIALLLALIIEQTQDRKAQVVTTTYSPTMLSMLSDEAFEDASIIARIDASPDAIIRPLSKLHRIRKLRASQGLGRLMTGRWMENVLEFTDGGVPIDE